MAQVQETTVALTEEAVQNIINGTKSRINTVISNLADVESTSTASKAYAVGDHLVYNGVLYEVTAAIASGATLVPNTNIEAAQVEDEIDKLFGMAEADYGAGVNLIDPKYIQSDTVINGVTYHVTEDYVINISGTMEGNWQQFDIFPGNSFPPYLQKGKTYKLVVNGTSNSHIWVAIHPYYSDAWGVPLAKIHIGTAYFTVPNDVTNIWIRTEIDDNYTGDCTASLGVMITEVNALTDKYYPKILTNKELMDTKLEIISSTTDIGEGAALADNVLYAVLEG